MNKPRYTIAEPAIAHSIKISLKVLKIDMHMGIYELHREKP
jgi:hypothetical protein